jgi:hypothetical protein
VLPVVRRRVDELGDRSTRWVLGPGQERCPLRCCGELRIRRIEILLARHESKADDTLKPIKEPKTIRVGRTRDLCLDHSDLAIDSSNELDKQVEVEVDDTTFMPEEQRRTSV